MRGGRQSDMLGPELPSSDRGCGQPGTRDHSGRCDHDDGHTASSTRPAEASVSRTARDASCDELVAGGCFEHRVEVLTDGEGEST
jgi:hypothetical protein